MYCVDVICGWAQCCYTVASERNITQCLVSRWRTNVPNNSLNELSLYTTFVGYILRSLVSVTALFLGAFACLWRTYGSPFVCVCVYTQNNTRYNNRKGKGTAVPLQAWSDPEGSRKLRFPDFMTTVQDGGKVVSLKHRSPLPPGNRPGTHFCWRLSRP
jgi:hypothetical protein